MKQVMILLGAAALVLAGPAIAKPGHGGGHDYGYGGCPPGLAKKYNGCMPPGQAKKLYRGERWRSGYGSYYAYRSIPYDIRARYALSARYRYYYGGGYLYAVDPRTMVIAQVISTILR
jgi:hypothetical protein